MKHKKNGLIQKRVNLINGDEINIGLAYGIDGETMYISIHKSLGDETLSPNLTFDELKKVYDNIGEIIEQRKLTLKK